MAEELSPQEGSGPPLRVLVAKIGMDGHDRGARVVARALRDGGIEVIYSGRHVPMEVVVQTALDEDVDVLGVSILSGAHVPLIRELYKVIDATDSREVFDIVVGGTVKTRQVQDELLSMGVADVFPGSTSLPDVVRRVKEVGLRRRQRVLGHQ
jgi:methylmalonyl-CoA mutase cobalamin-binding domain/chain